MCAATAGLWYVDMNLMGLFGKSPCKTDCARSTYKMMALLVGNHMEEMLSLSEVSDQAGFFMTCSVQVLPSCISTLGYWFGKQPNLTFGVWGWDMKPES